MPHTPPNPSILLARRGVAESAKGVKSGRERDEVREAEEGKEGGGTGERRRCVKDSSPARMTLTHFEPLSLSCSDGNPTHPYGNIPYVASTDVHAEFSSQRGQTTLQKTAGLASGKRDWNP
jgi:hypothetical protein